MRCTPITPFWQAGQPRKIASIDPSEFRSKVCAPPPLSSQDLCRYNTQVQSCWLWGRTSRSAAA